MPSAETLARALGDLTPASYLVGTFVSTNADSTVEIDFGDGAVTCLSSLNYTPLAGVSVRCLRINGGTLMLGEAFPTAILGTVTVAGSPLLTVTTSTGSQDLPYLASYTPRTVADEVVIFGGYVLGKPSASRTGSYTATTAAAGSYSVDFRADDSGTYYVPGTAYSTADVWCTSTGNNKGAWFYGATIANTIPDTATITRVQLYVNEFYNLYPTSLALVGLHTLETKSGSPTITSATTISAGSGWKELPLAFGTALMTGASKGVGTGSSGSSGYHKFRSRAADADSGLLRIDWTV